MAGPQVRSAPSAARRTESLALARELCHGRVVIGASTLGGGPSLRGVAVIGTFLIVWLCVVPAIWLAWAISHVPALFVSLTARVRKAVPYS